MNKELYEKLQQQVEKNDSILSAESFMQGAKFVFEQLSWQPIDRDNLPKGEVLARDKNYECLVGYIGEDKYGYINCESDEIIMPDCTHYIDLKTFEL